MNRPKKLTQERRRAERLVIPVQVKYKLLPDEKSLQEAVVYNISGTGIELKLARPFKKGCRLKIQLYFPGQSRPVKLTYKVIWCHKKAGKGRYYYYIGNEQIGINPPDKERFIFLFCEAMIAHYVRKGRYG